MLTCYLPLKCVGQEVYSHFITLEENSVVFTIYIKYVCLLPSLTFHTTLNVTKTDKSMTFYTVVKN